MCGDDIDALTHDEGFVPPATVGAAELFMSGVAVGACINRDCDGPVVWKWVKDVDTAECMDCGIAYQPTGYGRMALVAQAAGASMEEAA